jgi:hypothetical protein
MDVQQFIPRSCCTMIYVQRQISSQAVIFAQPRRYLPTRLASGSNMSWKGDLQRPGAHREVLHTPSHPRIWWRLQC